MLTGFFTFSLLFYVLYFYTIKFTLILADMIIVLADMIIGGTD